jgi:Mg2+ and Co2+ transporter CorA
LTQLGERFALHRLALEDVLNIPQRPKLDDYGDHQFIVARMPVAQEHLETEQLSVFLGKSFVLTVQERPGDCFDGIRRRLHDGRPRMRESGPDYLFRVNMNETKSPPKLMDTPRYNGTLKGVDHVERDQPRERGSRDQTQDPP